MGKKQKKCGKSRGAAVNIKFVSRRDSKKKKGKVGGKAYA